MKLKIKLPQVENRRLKRLWVKLILKNTMVELSEALGELYFITDEKLKYKDDYKYTKSVYENGRGHEWNGISVTHKYKNIKYQFTALDYSTNGKTIARCSQNNLLARIFIDGIDIDIIKSEYNKTEFKFDLPLELYEDLYNDILLMSDDISDINKRLKEYSEEAKLSREQILLNKFYKGESQYEPTSQ